MTSSLWPLVEFAARPLQRDERDAVLGDALESGESPVHAVLGVLGLVLRRQLLLWRSWRPWLAVLVGLPGTYLLMIVSVSVTCTYDRLMGLPLGHWAPTGHEGIPLLLCHIFLLVAWSWSGGFTLGSLSPRTLWLSAALCYLLVFSCDSHFRMLSISKLAPFLFLAPAIWGIQQGRRKHTLRLQTALFLAIAMTALTTTAWIDNALWILNWFLLVPAWYLVATARRPEKNETGTARQVSSQI